MHLDYSLTCGTPQHGLYRFLAIAMFLLVPIGFPAALWLSFRSLNKHQRLWLQARRRSSACLRDAGGVC